MGKMWCKRCDCLALFMVKLDNDSEVSLMDSCYVVV